MNFHRCLTWFAEELWESELGSAADREKLQAHIDVGNSIPVQMWRWMSISFCVFHQICCTRVVGVAIVQGRLIVLLEGRNNSLDWKALIIGMLHLTFLFIFHFTTEEDFAGQEQVRGTISF